MTRVLAMVVATAVLGCGGVSGSTVAPLAKIDGWRDHTQETLGHEAPFALVEIALDRETAEQAWRESVPDGLEERSGEPREPGIYGHLDDVDFASQAVVVWSSGQSGSCPGWLADIRVEDAATVHVTTAEHVAGDGCTDDYNPYAMVVVVDRARLPDAGDLPTDDVIVDGRDFGLGSVVDVYPAGGWPGQSG